MYIYIYIYIQCPAQVLGEHTWTVPPAFDIPASHPSISPARWLKSTPGVSPSLGWQRRIRLSERAD